MVSDFLRQPREAFGRLLAEPGSPGLAWLPLVAGMGFWAGRLPLLAQAGTPTGDLWLVLLLVGALTGLIGVFLMGALLRVIGGLFAGKASMRDCRLVAAWSGLAYSVPLACGVLGLLLGIEHLPLALMALTSLMALALQAIWLVVGVRKAHQLATGPAVATALAAGIGTLLVLGTIFGAIGLGPGDG
ncbi:MAG: YIP1 family protein [Opitutales bacterium]